MTDPAAAAAGLPPDAPAATDQVPDVYVAQVRWSDADIMGHVNHARYLSYFEDARMTLLARSPAGLAGASGDRGYIAARVAVDYHWPAEFRPGMILRVATTVSRIGATSWTFDQRIFEGGAAEHGAADDGAADDGRTNGVRLVARCECVLVAYSYVDGKPRPLDADERAFWQRYVSVDESNRPGELR